MVRLVLFLLAVAAAAAGLHWLADRPGTLALDWQGYVVETSVFRAVVLLALTIAGAVLAWSVLRQLWTSPAVVGSLIVRRREQRGLQALSSGIIAIGAGDRASATRSAQLARKALPNEPLTHLLRAQAAQLQGDSATARRIFEAMLATPDTEQLGLRGLFLEAERVGEQEAARQFAERAMRLNPKSDWPVEALFDLQCKARDWDGALDTLASGKRNGLVDRKIADRRRAVLLTAQAQASEDDGAEKALGLAQEAHSLAPDLVPAAAIAGRILASRGQTPKAAKVIQRTWKLAPHPDLAAAYAYARTGDSVGDRLERIRTLTRLNPGSVEGPIALATAAIEAKEWEVARETLGSLVDEHLTQRVATLMARLEGEQHGSAGGVREWLARTVNAPRDPVWTADGIVSDTWAPVSPVTGALDAFQWKVPVEAMDKPDSLLLKAKLEELVQLGAAVEPRLTVSPAPRAAAADAPPEIVVVDDPAPPAKLRPVPVTVPVPVEDAVEIPVRTLPAAKPVVSPPAKAAVVEAPPPSKPSVAPVKAVEEPARRRTAQDYVILDGDSGWVAAEPAKPSTPPERERKTPAEPKVYIAARPPDDPGPETDAARRATANGHRGAVKR